MKLAPIHSGRIVLTTFGSLGDLNPFIALARGLRNRGFRPVIATSEFHRDAVSHAGIDFHAIRPDLDPADKDLLRRAMHPRRGTEVILREIVFPALYDTYTDLDTFLQSTDVLITHSISYAGHIVAQKRGLAWVSVALSPLVFMSADDWPALQGIPFSVFLGKLGPVPRRMLVTAIKRLTRRWCRPVVRLRNDLGLAPGKHPIFEGQFSPHLVLAMFSNILAPRQSDWPPHTHITGFGFYDEVANQSGRNSDLDRFMTAGPPPVVIALGSVAVHVAGDFYRTAAKVAAMLQRRAVLVVGEDTHNLTAEGLPPGVLSVEYAPYSALFPNASAIVHQGGIGTTGQALRAGKPTVVVPFAHDQPDNARRLERVGISRTLPLKRCSSIAMARVLEEVLTDSEIIGRAARVGRQVHAENGVENACDEIEALLMLKKKKSVKPG